MNNRGQMRTVEALLASGIIAVAMTVMINVVKPPDPYVTKSRSDFTRYCYDFLMTLADEEVFDRVMFTPGGMRRDWEGLMKNMLNALLPPNILYNMTVYNMTQTGVGMEPAFLGTVSNASPEDFRIAREATGADITYTTRSRWVLKIHLELARR
ncbi:MAG: hypothetical protein QXM02_06215 [Thermoproteota archaeon]